MFRMDIAAYRGFRTLRQVRLVDVSVMPRCTVPDGIDAAVQRGELRGT